MKLKTLIGYFSPTLRENQRCESCQKDFICGASLRGCWCSEITLSKTTLNKLRDQYKRCLCRDCLEKFAVMSDNQSNIA